MQVGDLVNQCVALWPVLNRIMKYHISYRDNSLQRFCLATVQRYDIQKVPNLHVSLPHGIAERSVPNRLVRPSSWEDGTVEILCIFPMYIQHTTVYSFT